MGRLASKTALISGGSSGIGRAVALAFAREGCDVAINYFSPAEASDAAALQKEIEDIGQKSVTVQADVTQPDQVTAMVDSAIDALGGIDILVCNAGVATTAPVQDLPVEDWTRVITTNLTGTFLCCKAVVPHMVARGSGRIINNASQLAYKGAPGFTHYCASKGGIISFTRSLALELASTGITANCVAPGATETAILGDVTDDLLAAIAAQIPRGRMSEPEEIAPAFVFLASDEAAHMVGQTVSPNGGDVFL